MGCMCCGVFGCVGGGGGISVIMHRAGHGAGFRFVDGGMGLWVQGVWMVGV